MPKGISAAKAGIGVGKGAAQLVPPGATVYPNSHSPEFPEGLPIPDGIRIRTGRSVELRFYIDGQRVSETVRGKPTIAFVQEVARKRERVQQLIGLGKFGDAEYREEFPESPRFKRLSHVESVMTVGEALDEWMGSRANSMGQNTTRDYQLIIRNQLKPFKFPEGLIPASTFVRSVATHSHAVELTKARHEGGPARAIDPFDSEVLGALPVHLLTDVLISAMRSHWLVTEGLSIKRVNNLMAPLRGALSRLVALKKLPLNPFELIAPLKSERAPLMSSEGESTLDEPLPSDDCATFIRSEGAPEPFSIQEIELLLAQCDAAMANQFCFAFFSGLRTGETIALRVSDLQLDQDRICVRRSVSRGILKTTKTNQQRWVKLLPLARAAIEAQLALLGAPGGWVFPNPFTRNRWANDSKITRRWTKVLEQAGLRYRRPYQTRHTYASLMLSAGENVMYVAGQMGHADWSMLVKVYAEWLPDSSQFAAGSLIEKAHSRAWGRMAEVIRSLPTVTDDASEVDEGCSVGEM